MLKRKRSRARLFGHGLLFMAVPYGTIGSIMPANAWQKEAASAAPMQKRWILPLLKDTGNLSLPPADSSLLQATSGSEKKTTAPAIRLNTTARKFIAHYLKQNSESLEVIKKRSAIPFQIIEQVFENNNLPLQLKYLAVVESELKAKAVSRVGAAGPWQLMRGTARTLGLKITKKYDERTQYYKSTAAAAKYLKSLYAQFDDWLLVIAAYNSGAGPVYRAIRLSGSRNFWKLQAYLPLETRLHVKRFIGTHYFFEQEGSITVLSKAERDEYNKATELFINQSETVVTKRRDSSMLQAIGEK
ncbi:MAG: lytic transglycosylase domain-containing protein [Flavisolibacter sp.]|nr:lytic transglycosylase domain-containing protein [Flavisolibacter sp.]